MSTIYGKAKRLRGQRVIITTHDGEVEGAVVNAGPGSVWLVGGAGAGAGDRFVPYDDIIDIEEAPHADARV